MKDIFKLALLAAAAAATGGAAIPAMGAAGAAGAGAAGAGAAGGAAGAGLGGLLGAGGAAGTAGAMGSTGLMAMGPATAEVAGANVAQQLAPSAMQSFMGYAKPAAQAMNAATQAKGLLGSGGKQPIAPPQPMQNTGGAQGLSQLYSQLQGDAEQRMKAEREARAGRRGGMF